MSQRSFSLNDFVFVSMLLLGVFEQHEAYVTWASTRDDFLHSKGSVIPLDIWDSTSSRCLFSTFQSFLGLLRLSFASNYFDNETKKFRTSFSPYSWMVIVVVHSLEAAMWWTFAIHRHKSPSFDLSLITKDINSIILLAIVPAIAGFLLFASIIDISKQKNGGYSLKRKD